MSLTISELKAIEDIRDINESLQDLRKLLEAKTSFYYLERKDVQEPRPLLVKVDSIIIMEPIGFGPMASKCGYRITLRHSERPLEITQESGEKLWENFKVRASGISLEKFANG